MSAISNRYEFVYLFDATNSNPNGDPDAGNLPRIDPETSKGLVTDVCLKRKIRNYVSISKASIEGHKIYVTEKAVLNTLNKEAYKALGIDKIEPKKLPKEEEKAHALTAWMCKNFFDIRAFGAVMTTDVNCGQVRGPVQLAFATSIDPIVPQEISITRMAVTHEKDKDKERTMGRKHIVPYGLYRVHGYVSAKLAEQTGFSEDDLQLLWDALQNMYEHDRSAARGDMSARKLYVFKHSSDIGSAPAHKLFETIKVQRKDSSAPARVFADYSITTTEAPKGVERMELL
ncbi:MAG: type I-C CRISPR-associated protein Cas7/Csd2 [Pseudomonadota bacterium]|nr:type I-C CRISPR-associated protein Cas7/Csd2 [Pseudomonadota bacterium]